MFEINQLIWYMQDNKVHSARVLSRMIIENSPMEAHNKEQREFYQRFGEAGVTYATVHGTYGQDRVFGSKQDLLDSL